MYRNEVNVKVTDLVEYWKCCIEITYLDDVKYTSNVLWCMKHSILEGALYIPNDKSKYANSDIFDSIQSDIFDIKSKHDVTGICILGDMNARTGCLNELIYTNG